MFMVQKNHIGTPGSNCKTRKGYQMLQLSNCKTNASKLSEKTWVPSISAFFPFRHSPCLALSILQNWINILCTVFSFSPTADMLLGRLFVPFQILYVFQDRYITSYVHQNH